MNKLILIIAALAMVTSACQSGADRKADVEENQVPTAISTENLVTISFDVEGMTCAGCEGSVVSSLKNIDGVAEAKASHQTGKTEVVFDKALVTEEAMEKAIASRGYKVTGHSPSQ